MLHSLDCFVDPVSSGLIGILPDSTAGLLRFKCVLTLVTISVLVSALKPDLFRRGCHIIAFNRGTEAAEVPTENKIIKAFGIHNKHRDNMT